MSATLARDRVARDAPQYNATLVRRVDLTNELAHFWVRLDGGPISFEPGQYLTIGVVADGRVVQRPYSVASSPSDARGEGYEFFVRLVTDGAFTPPAVADGDRPAAADDRAKGAVHPHAR